MWYNFARKPRWQSKHAMHAHEHGQWVSAPNWVAPKTPSLCSTHRGMQILENRRGFSFFDIPFIILVSLSQLKKIQSFTKSENRYSNISGPQPYYVLQDQFCLRAVKIYQVCAWVNKSKHQFHFTLMNFDEFKSYIHILKMCFVFKYPVLEHMNRSDRIPTT